MDSGVRQKARKILLVDDEPVLLHVTARFVERLGFVAVAVTTATAAIDALDAAVKAGDPFHTVLLDLILGQEDGENVLDHLETFRDKPRVIVISGAQVDAHRWLRLRGRCEVMPKPLVTAVLAEVLVSPFWRRLDVFTDRAGFSPREADVLRLAANGLDDPGIAMELDCARETVRTYWERMAAKLGTSGRAGVMGRLVRWFEHGGLPGGPAKKSAEG